MDEGDFTRRLDEVAELKVSEVDAGAEHVLYHSGDAAIKDHVLDDRGRLRLFYDVLSALPGRDVLDVGANPYLLTYALARSGKRVIATGVPAGPDDARTGASVRFHGASPLDVPLWR